MVPIITSALRYSLGKTSVLWGYYCCGSAISIHLRTQLYGKKLRLLLRAQLLLSVLLLSSFHPVGFECKSQKLQKKNVCCSNYCEFFWAWDCRVSLYLEKPVNKRPFCLDKIWKSFVRFSFCASCLALTTELSFLLLNPYANPCLFRGQYWMIVHIGLKTSATFG